MKDSFFNISYIETNSPIHKLNGITKFILFLSWISILLSTFDIRFILFFIILGFVLLKISKISFQTYKIFILSSVGILLLNAFFMFLLAPNQGSKYLKTQTVLLSLPFYYSISKETAFYLLVVTLKYFSIFPIALLFVFTTHPSEFAASLNRLGIPYKIAYAVSLTLRYLPEVKRNFIYVMQAQQMRGLKLSKKESIFTKIKNLSTILNPVIFLSIEKAEHISNAMNLRGFGLYKTRTWYNFKQLQKKDFVIIILSSSIAIVFIIKRFIDKELFWYPF